LSLYMHGQKRFRNIWVGGSYYMYKVEQGNVERCDSDESNKVEDHSTAVRNTR
jgi:hypothetical protein